MFLSSFQVAEMKKIQCAGEHGTSVHLHDDSKNTGKAYDDQYILIEILIDILIPKDQRLTRQSHIFIIQLSSEHDSGQVLIANKPLIYRSTNTLIH